MGETVLEKKDLYYTLAVILVIVFFGVWVIPQFTNMLNLHATPLWALILVDCVVLPLAALSLLYLIIITIQSHYKTETSSEDKEEEIPLTDEAFTEEDVKFIEKTVRQQLEENKYEDEEVFELSKDLVLNYLKTRMKTDKVIPLNDISQRLEIPVEVVKNMILLLVADNLIYGMIQGDALISSD